MAAIDGVKTVVRALVKARLDALADPKSWPMPVLATDIDEEEDAYLAVRKYTDEEVDPDRRPGASGPERWNVGARLVPLQRVIHSITLTRTDAHELQVSPRPRGPDAPASPRWKLSQLATEARLTQLGDFLDAVKEKAVDEQTNVPEKPLALTAVHLERAIEAMETLGRVVLVMFSRPRDDVEAVVEKHDEVMDSYPLHELLPERENKVSTVSAFLIGGTPPLSMRYLAHDLVASVEDDRKGLRVAIEERRGWWVPTEPRLALFESS